MKSEVLFERDFLDHGFSRIFAFRVLQRSWTGLYIMPQIE